MGTNISPAVSIGQQPGCFVPTNGAISLADMGKARTPHNRTITPADKAAAARLKAIWREHKANHGGKPTQDDLADAWGDGANQSLISQYINGRIALNAKAVRFFAAQLNVPASAIRTDLEELPDSVLMDERPDSLKIARLENDIHALNLALGAMASVMVHHRPAEASELAEALKALPKEFRNIGFAQALHEELARAVRKRKAAV